ncbi:M15 family metallopeptidase [Actinoplanes sp. N902-109]|uniref:M15 family metallopeptidase n=1 Tax=Actinoplanes sp. (strain N902-109) TaxID=649831 RepID=UPI00032966FC|nr:M15 family metallopeptidase [Actinoplanes sp. N902-109]AGL19489.1 hypothetical protein L083_5979 [Actinoplanes sp. N902-109]
MPTSQNGYRANDPSLIASYTIPGTSVKIALRKGDVSVVLLHFAAWFNKNIEPLRQSDTGGYVERTIRGSSTTLSNHASGTAEDLRWNDHPLGAVGTFTAAEKAKINAQLGYYEGVIRWGANYSGRKDEMHFEINKGTADVKRVADKIRNADKAKTEEDLPVLQADYNKLFLGALRDKTIRAELGAAMLDAAIGDPDYTGRRVEQVLVDVAKLRGVLVGDTKDAARVSAGAPVKALVKLPAQVAELQAAVKAITAAPAGAPKA